MYLQIQGESQHAGYSNLTLERPRGEEGGGDVKWTPHRFSNLKFETLKQSKWNFQYL